MAATGIVQIWWEVWCVAEEGFYVAEYSMLGICRRVEVCRYGPLAGDELDRSSTPSAPLPCYGAVERECGSSARRRWMSKRSSTNAEVVIPLELCLAEKTHGWHRSTPVRSIACAYWFAPESRRCRKSPITRPPVDITATLSGPWYCRL
jgi:hypothetical protein